MRGAGAVGRGSPRSELQLQSKEKSEQGSARDQLSQPFILRGLACRDTVESFCFFFYNVVVLFFKIWM